MRAALAMTAILLFAGLASGDKSVQNDQVFRAMGDELDRSIKELAIEGMPRPYFLSYSVQDNVTATFEARYNALTAENLNRERYIYIDLRVGDPSFDNSNFVGNWQHVWNHRKSAVEEDDYQSLCRQLWLRTDEAYKSALERFAGKQAYVQTHPTQSEIADLTPVEKFEHIEEPVKLDADISGLREGVVALADVLGEFAGLQDWRVNLAALSVNRRYLNSEASRNLTGMRFDYLTASATVQADDGERLTGCVTRLIPGGSLQFDDALQAEVRALAGDLVAASTSPALESYAGPVLFEGNAGAQLISQLFVSQLALTRAPLVIDDWINQYLPVGKIAARLNRRVFPEFISVRDDPGLRSWEGAALAGYSVVDDEGVRSEPVELVREGRLVGLPMTRQPLEKLTGSNGHAVTLPNQWTQPCVTNLLVTGSRTLPEKKLHKKLRDLSREFGNEYGLLIRLLDDPRTSEPYLWTEQSSDDAPLLTSPVLLYKVYVADGRMEPVRGLVFEEVTVRSLRDITALGGEAVAYNILQNSIFERFGYPATIVTPSILVEEMELKRNTRFEPLPITGNPIFNK